MKSVTLNRTVAIVLLLVVFSFSPLATKIFEKIENSYQSNKTEQIVVKEIDQVEALLKSDVWPKLVVLPLPKLNTIMKVKYKPLTETKAGFICTLTPAHPDRPSQLDVFTIHIGLKDKDGFEIGSFSIKENEMTSTLGSEDIIVERNFQTDIEFEIQKLVDIDDLGISWNISEERKKKYDELENSTPVEIVQKRREEERIRIEKEQKEAALAQRQALEKAEAEIKQKAENEQKRLELNNINKQLMIDKWATIFIPMNIDKCISILGPYSKKVVHYGGCTYYWTDPYEGSISTNSKGQVVKINEPKFSEIID